MEKKILAFIILGIFLFSIMPVSAWMPESHTYMNDQALSVASNSDAGKLVAKGYYDEIIACDILTDISVFYYFSEGFNSISTKYKQTHTQNLCDRMIKLAVTDSQKACAIGVCAHHVQDAVSHNDFVPKVIERTKLTNGLVHALAEEDVNDQVRTKEITAKTRQALVNVAPKQKEFFRQALVSENSDFPFDSMYDAFVTEVVGSDVYSVGFRGFTAIPFSIHMIMIMMFLFLMIAMAWLLRRENKTLFNKISIFLLFLVILFIIGLYVLFYTGKLWVAFQSGSGLVTWAMPTYGWEASINDATQETIKMFNQGSSYVLAVTPDPAGEQALIKVGQTGAWLRTIIMFILGGLIALFVWLNIRTSRRKRRNGTS